MNAVHALVLCVAVSSGYERRIFLLWQIRSHCRGGDQEKVATRTFATVQSFLQVVADSGQIGGDTSVALWLWLRLQASKLCT